MIPAIITTPRSDSTLITNILHRYAATYLGSKAYLGEFFSFYERNSYDIEVIDGILTRTNYQWLSSEDEILKRRSQLQLNRHLLLQDRIELLKKYPDHTLKIMISRLPDDLMMWIKETYDCIFLDRRNKADQLLSYLLVYDNKSHYLAGDSIRAHVVADLKWAKLFVEMQNRYEEYKNTFDNPKIVYYEDLIVGEVDQVKILNGLGYHVDERYIPIHVDTIATPYEKNKIDYFINADDVIEFMHSNNIPL